MRPRPVHPMVPNEKFVHPATSGIYICSWVRPTAHIAIIFTYMEMPLSPLSYYAHSILLCYSSGVSGPTMYATVDTGTYKFVSILPPTNHVSATPWQCCKSSISWSWGTLWWCYRSLTCLGQVSLLFFVVWSNLRSRLIWTGKYKIT